MISSHCVFSSFPLHNRYLQCINWVVGKLLHKRHANNEAAAAIQLAEEKLAADETNLPSSEENTTADVEKDTPGFDVVYSNSTAAACSLGTGVYVGTDLAPAQRQVADDNNCCAASGGDNNCCGPTDPENFHVLKHMADHIQNVEPKDDIDDEEAKVIAALKKDAHQLMHMGAATALAIAIHNFPEGLVTFVAYTQDPAVGVVLAIGIGVHNIPEGLCVAMPIYYATGNRWKAFMWGILSGVSEPLGALFGYVVLKGSMSGNTYGILFGVVAGIMTLIAADELLPTAHRYDPKNEVVTYAFIFGMLAIAGSLVIFSN
jgi:zinc transporter ZupT